MIEDWDVPVQGFRFQKRLLNSWCDGKQRKLHAGRHFPRAMPLDDVMLRLKRAAYAREVTATIWPDGEGNINILFGVRQGE